MMSPAHAPRRRMVAATLACGVGIAVPFAATQVAARSNATAFDPMTGIGAPYAPDTTTDTRTCTNGVVIVLLGLSSMC